MFASGEDRYGGRRDQETEVLLLYRDGHAGSICGGRGYSDHGAGRQFGHLIERERERERERETDRQTDRQTDRERDRQTDRQTDRGGIVSP